MLFKATAKYTCSVELRELPKNTLAAGGSQLRHAMQVAQAKLCTTQIRASADQQAIIRTLETVAGKTRIVRTENGRGGDVTGEQVSGVCTGMNYPAHRQYHHREDR